ncbi:MAG: hypothetical protein QM817_24475 [Archangium sp.]
MSIEKSRNVLIVSVVAVALSACGVGTTPASDGDEQALTPAQQQPQTPAERLKPTVPVAQLGERPQVQQPRVEAVIASSSVVVAHSLAVPDGTQVQYLLGMSGCGIWVIASGTATVRNGSFEMPFNPAETAGFESVGLYFRTGTGPCDENTQVYETAAPLPGAVDLSTAQPTTGCWMFGE